jgi:hypothetical protein
VVSQDDGHPRRRYGAPGDPYADFRAAHSPEPGEPWIEGEMETISIN